MLGECCLAAVLSDRLGGAVGAMGLVASSDGLAAGRGRRGLAPIGRAFGVARARRRLLAPAGPRAQGVRDGHPSPPSPPSLTDPPEVLAGQRRNFANFGRVSVDRALPELVSVGFGTLSA